MAHKSVAASRIKQRSPPPPLQNSSSFPLPAGLLLPRYHPRKSSPESKFPTKSVQDPSPTRSPPSTNPFPPSHHRLLAQLDPQEPCRPPPSSPKSTRQESRRAADHGTTRLQESPPVAPLRPPSSSLSSCSASDSIRKNVAAFFPKSALQAPPSTTRLQESPSVAPLPRLLLPTLRVLLRLGRHKLAAPRPRTRRPMEKGHGRRHRKGRGPRLPDLVVEGAPPAQDRGKEAARRALLPELVGKGAPPAQDRGEEAARRARLAALIEALWAGLQELGRLLRSVFFARRHLVEVELPAAEEEEEVLLGGPRKGCQRQDGGGPRKSCQRQGGGDPRQGGGVAMLYANKLPGRQKKEPRRPSSPPPSPLLMVKGKIVSKHLKMQYQEYCRIRALVPVSSCLCHMCFFEMPRHDHMTIQKKKMITHCNDMHLGTGKVCQVTDCGVRVRTERDYQLHMHFCHPDVPY